MSWPQMQGGAAQAMEELLSSCENEADGVTPLVTLWEQGCCGRILRHSSSTMSRDIDCLDVP